MIVLLLAVGGTYAYWTTTQVQEDKNVIDTTCLRVELLNKTGVDGTDTSGIKLEKAYPISDDEGKLHRDIHLQLKTIVVQTFTTILIWKV